MFWAMIASSSVSNIISSSSSHFCLRYISTICLSIMTSYMKHSRWDVMMISMSSFSASISSACFSSSAGATLLGVVTVVVTVSTFSILCTCFRNKGFLQEKTETAHKWLISSQLLKELARIYMNVCHLLLSSWLVTLELLEAICKLLATIRAWWNKIMYLFLYHLMQPNSTFLRNRFLPCPAPALMFKDDFSSSRILEASFKTFVTFSSSSLVFMDWKSSWIERRIEKRIINSFFLLKKTFLTVKIWEIDSLVLWLLPSTRSS